MPDTSPPSESRDTWTMREASTRDGPLIIRRATRYDDEREVRRALPVRIRITIGFNDNIGPMAPALSKLEDALEERSDRRAVVVLVLTALKSKDFVLHCASGEWVPEFHKSLRKEFPGLDVQVTAEIDPDWDMYMEFAESETN